MHAAEKGSLAYCPWQWLKTTICWSDNLHRGWPSVSRPKYHNLVCYSTEDSSVKSKRRIQADFTSKQRSMLCCSSNLWTILAGRALGIIASVWEDRLAVMFLNQQKLVAHLFNMLQTLQSTSTTLSMVQQSLSDTLSEAWWFKSKTSKTAFVPQYLYVTILSIVHQILVAIGLYTGWWPLLHDYDILIKAAGDRIWSGNL